MKSFICSVSLNGFVCSLLHSSTGYISHVHGLCRVPANIEKGVFFCLVHKFHCAKTYIIFLKYMSFRQKMGCEWSHSMDVAPYYSQSPPCIETVRPLVCYWKCSVIASWQIFWNCFSVALLRVLSSKQLLNGSLHSDKSWLGQDGSSGHLRQLEQCS